MWFITFSTKHPICKTSLRLSRSLIKLKVKTLQVCLSEFSDNNRLIVLYFQVININPHQLQLHLLATGDFADLSRIPFLTEYINKRMIFSVFIIQSEEK